jgi:hypothetical protein
LERIGATFMHYLLLLTCRELSFEDRALPAGCDLAIRRACSASVDESPSQA